MIFFCEECGAKNDTDAKELIIKSGYLQCQHCNDILWMVPLEKVKPRLELKHGSKVIVVNRNRSMVSLGREDDCDIIFEDDFVSRSHAVIVCRDDVFVVIDQSKNGTFIYTQGKKEVVVCQDEFTLEGIGIISLARKLVPDSPNNITFNTFSQTDDTK